MQTTNIDSRKVDIIQWIASLDDSVLLDKLAVLKSDYLAKITNTVSKDIYVDESSVAFQHFVNDAVNAQQQFETTKLHTTHAEMKQWLTALKNDPKTKVPECHQ